MPVLDDVGDLNPFHVKLEPVPGNPYQSDPYTAAQPPEGFHDPLGPVVTALGQSVLSRVMTPGDVVKGVEPAESGKVSDEDVARQLMLDRRAQIFGPDQAMAMVGTGMPMAQRGAAGMAGGGVKVYHGSPHDFDKFDIGKIGTGEGAQAYGHGLYFAENPETAQTYKLAGAPKPGRMYEVNINADPEHFLDWDKPLNEQHSSVADKLSTIVKDRNRTPAEWIKSSPGAEERLREAGIPGIKYLDQGSRAPRDVEAQIADLRNRISNTERHPADPTARAQQIADDTAKLATLEKQRDTPTHNYVVFHHDIVDILKKYGLAGLVAAGAAHFKTTPANNNPFAAQQ